MAAGLIEMEDVATALVTRALVADCAV